jgi:hypothetical protein
MTDKEQSGLFAKTQSVYLIKKGLRVIVWVKKQHKSHKVAVDIEE